MVKEKSAMEKYADQIWKDFLLELAGNTCRKCGETYYEPLKYDVCQHCIDIINDTRKDTRC